MKYYAFILLLSGLMINLSCNSGNGSDKEYSFDTLDVHSCVIPCDSLQDSDTYNGISVAVIKDRFVSQDSDVYIKMNMTALDQNPLITEDLIGFALSNLSDCGFLNTPDSVMREKYDLSLLNDKSSQEILNEFSEFVGDEFRNVLPIILDYDCGYNMEILIYPVFLNEDYVTYDKYASYYTGGAHGNHTSFLQTFNVRTGKTLELEDIILPEKLNNLREIVVNYMASHYPLGENINDAEEYLVSLNEWLGVTDAKVLLGNDDETNGVITVENFPLNNPGIHKNGLVFSYDKYQLTPGSYGCPEIIIPYDQIRDYLKEPFKEY